MVNIVSDQKSSQTSNLSLTAVKNPNKTKNKNPRKNTIEQTPNP